MKKLITFLLILVSIQSFASDFYKDVRIYSSNTAIVHIYTDTTFAGTTTWNLSGAILDINAIIKGNVTITNALIEANSYIQIFDTNVVIGAGCRIREFSAMWYGAKITNNNNSVYLQRCIDACTTSSLHTGFPLYVPTGNFTIQQPLIVAVLTGAVTYIQASIKMYGDASFWDNGYGSQITYTGDSCAIGLQSNKGSDFSHLIISGLWQSPHPSDSAYYNLSFAEYTNQAAKGNGQGIWIDIISNFSRRSGSTGCKFSDLKIEGFQTLIQVSNSVVQNGEIMLFEHIQFGQGKVGFDVSQPQEKGNIIRGLYSWDRIHTLFSEPAGQQAGNYYIDEANIAGYCIRLFDINVSLFFPSHISKIYAENFGQIGNITSGGLPVHISDCVFDFNTPNNVGNMTLLTTNSNLIKFDNCMFRYYGLNGTTLKFAAQATFENCFFTGPVIGTTNSVFINYKPAQVEYQTTQEVYKIDTAIAVPWKIILRKSNIIP